MRSSRYPIVRRTVNADTVSTKREAICGLSGASVGTENRRSTDLAKRRVTGTYCYTATGEVRIKTFRGVFGDKYVGGLSGP